MLDFMDRRQRRAKTSFVCELCGRTIAPGSDYIRVCWSQKGRIKTQYKHIACDALSIAYGQALKKHECSGVEVEAWIRGTVCFQCSNKQKCSESPFACSVVLDAAITNECTRMAIDEAAK